LEHWVNELQARGRYTFLRSEALTGSGLSPEAAKKALQRLARRRRVVKIKDYFFVIVPLEYREAGAPPAVWFIHDLMSAMGLRYYIGLLTAAGLHGASPQQPQEFQVVTTKSVRPLAAGRTRIRFFASRFIPRVAVVELKTPTGSVRVSGPEATAVDLVRFARAAGHLDYVAEVLRDLVPRLDAKRLLSCVRAVGDVSNARRLGFVLDSVRARSLTRILHAWVARQGPGPVPLRSGRPLAGAREDRRWHVLVNGRLEAER
jgi:predicted transcriptional regulator of viral defense system